MTAHHSGFGRTFLSPLLVVALILISLLVVELLLGARFWLQLTADDPTEGLGGTVLDVTDNLVAPFEDVSASQDEAIGNVDRSTLIAAIGYVILAVALVAITVVVAGLISGASRMSTRGRRSIWRGAIHNQTELPSLSQNLRKSVYLRMTPEQAGQALRKLEVDRYSSQIVIIPAQGGSIVAVFDGEGAGWSMTRKLQAAREDIRLSRIFRTLAERPDSEPASAA